MQYGYFLIRLVISPYLHYVHSGNQFNGKIDWLVMKGADNNDIKK